MSGLLWPDDPVPELQKEFRQVFTDDDQVCFIARVRGDDAGFVNVSLRRAYVPGASTSPVGYLEGLFVHERFRRQGVARALVAAAEDWAIQRGCTEMGSDTWEWNEASQIFHQQAGYRIYETLVHFIKKL